MRVPDTYYTIKEARLAEYDADTWQLYHKKSGARIFVVKNEDPNRVFTIGFRTPPQDSTGLPHILEHSVLCGSEKFPIKDPFIELEKSSLKTFLNAMTYPDKTIYPVASCNEKDFRNLMDVYMDAVLHPAIHQEEKIFRQEGWHYELEDPEGPLTINGVVYNEMKGAFSSADDVLERYAQMVLYPDTPYTHESGGDPDVIPELSYEDFTAFHKKYYHPANSFIFLYGDLDVEEQLKWLDSEYLGDYDAILVSSGIPEQKPFPEPAEKHLPYPVGREEDPSGKYYLSEQWVCGRITDPKAYMAWQILSTVLLMMPGAPLYQALTDAGIGEEVYGGYQCASLQPYFQVVAKNAKEEDLPRFRRIIREVLKQQAEEGIDPKSLESALNALEFKQREADYGPYPKGLVVGIECFDSWLYDQDPLMHLQYEETFAWLREHRQDGYFEGLIREELLDNSHSAVIVLEPVPGLTEEKDAGLAKKLSDYKASLSKKEIRKLVEETAALKAFQEEPASEEALKTLPVLELSDIRREAAELKNREKMIEGIPVIHHEIHTSGILYPRVLFRADTLCEEDVRWLGLMRCLLMQMSTSERSYRELGQEVGLHTGGVSLGLPSFQNVEQPGSLSPYIEINARVLKEKLPKALELMREILLETDFTDEKRLKDLLTETSSRLTTGLVSAGHSTAMLRASSYTSLPSWYADQIGGIGFLDFLKETCALAETEGGAAQIAARLDTLRKKLFVRSGMLISLTAPEEDFGLFKEAFAAFLETFPAGDPIPAEDSFRPSFAAWTFVPEKKNEAFATAAQIQYVAACGDYLKAGPYTGALRVLRKILGDEYLWTNVRVKGGAYGCMCGFGLTGSGYFVSYRDPNLGETLEIYEGIEAYLAAFDASDRDMAGYVIGTIGGMDHPMNPAEEGSASFQAYMAHITQERIQQSREEVLSCDVQTIRSLAPYVRAVLDCRQICVVGNAGRIESEKERFGEIRTLG